MIRCKWFIAVEQVISWVTVNRQVVNPLWLQRKMPYFKPACAQTAIAHQTEGGSGSAHHCPTDKQQLEKSFSESLQWCWGVFGFTFTLCILSHSPGLAVEGQVQRAFGTDLPMSHRGWENDFIFKYPQLPSHQPSYLMDEPALTSPSKLWFCNLYLHLFCLLCSLYGCYWKQGQWSTFSIISEVKHGSPI